MRALLLALLLPPLVALADDAPAPSGPTPKVGVIAFAALSGDVPQRAGTKAAAMLSNELKNTESLQLVEPKRNAPADPFHDALAHAKSLFDDGQAQRAQHKFRLAEGSLTQAIDAYKASGAGMTDVAELQDAYA